MPLLDSVVTYLGTTGGANLGLTIGHNLFKVPFPEDPTAVADAAVCVIEYPGREATYAHGTASQGAPVFEFPRFQVIVRDTLNNFETARKLAQDIYLKLEFLNETTLSGTRYAMIRAQGPPFPMATMRGSADDENSRTRFVCNYEATKERG